jgi:hypothetical protein
MVRSSTRCAIANTQGLQPIARLVGSGLTKGQIARVNQPGYHCISRIRGVRRGDASGILFSIRVCHPAVAYIVLSGVGITGCAGRTRVFVGEGEPGSLPPVSNEVYSGDIRWVGCGGGSACSISVWDPYSEVGLEFQRTVRLYQETSYIVYIQSTGCDARSSNRIVHRVDLDADRFSFGGHAPREEPWALSDGSSLFQVSPGYAEKALCTRDRGPFQWDHTSEFQGSLRIQPVWRPWTPIDHWRFPEGHRRCTSALYLHLTSDKEGLPTDVITMILSYCGPGWFIRAGPRDKQAKLK